MIAQRRAWTAAAIALLPVGCVALYLRDPAQGGIYPPCPFHALTGLDCPGCGTLRALHQLTHGHASAAFGLNPLAIVVLPIALYALGSAAHSALTGREHNEPRISGRWAWLVPIAIGAFWLLRNMPWPAVRWMSAFH